MKWNYLFLLAGLIMLCLGTPAFGAFQDNHDGTITDTATGLMWQKCSMGQTYNASTNGCDGSASSYTWQQALAECESLVLAGHSDWRLPNRNELQSIVDYSRYDPAIDTTYFPNIPSGWFGYWSSTTYADDTSDAWRVYFSNGLVYGSNKDYNGYVRAVRSGQGGSFGNLVITAPPKRLPPQQISPSPAGSTKAVVVTHGWNSNVDSWVLEMGQKICDSINATDRTSYYYMPDSDMVMRICSGNGWDVYLKDWRNRAKHLKPSNAWSDAQYVGEGLAAFLHLVNPNYTHIHLIAHSAGSNLINNATKQLKKKYNRNGKSIEIHDTFLDAYDPRKGISDYGKWADWADNYVDTRPLELGDHDGTQCFLQNAYNIDVTPSSDLCDSLGFIEKRTCRHDRPVRFYGKSISWDFVGDSSHATNDPIESTDSVGFVLSLERGQSISSLDLVYHKGEKCIMKDSICYQETMPFDVIYYAFSNVRNTTVKTVKGNVNYSTGTGATLFNSLELQSVSSLASQSINSGDMMIAQEAAPGPVEGPAWIILKVTTESPTNILKFNWKFKEGGEGFLRIFVDNRLVREMDQRYLPLESTEAEEVYIGDANGTLPAGDHEIAFRLDGFSSNGTSGVELTDVELLQKEVSENVSALGDVSGDGKINIVDALFVARYAVKLPVSNFNANAADVNCDGSVNIIDALLIARKSVGLPVPAWCGSGK